MKKARTTIWGEAAGFSYQPALSLTGMFAMRYFRLSGKTVKPFVRDLKENAYDGIPR